MKMNFMKYLRIAKSNFFFLFLFMTLLCSCQNQKNNWPQFRGPDSNQIADGRMLPLKWDSENVAWKFDLQGRGWSSPIVWEDQVFFTNAVLEDPSVLPPARGGARTENPDSAVYDLEVICLDLNTGAEIWKKVAYHGFPTYKTHRDNNYASETMVTDGNHVYAYFGMTGVYCYDMDGNLIWKKNLGTYPMQSNWGTATSPLLYNGVIYLQIDNEETSFLAALDSGTGEEKWRVERVEKSNWGTPVIWKNSIRTELIAPGVNTRSYNPVNGNLYWEVKTGGGRNSASPAMEGDMIIFGNEKRGNDGGILFGLKAGASGNISLKEGEDSNEYIIWSVIGSGIAMASPLIYKGLVYVVSRQGQLFCCDVETGEIIYPGTRLTGAKAFWASPWAYNGKIYCLEEAGSTYVIEAGNELKELDMNKLEGDIFWATPALGKNSYVFRGEKGIYCVR